MTALEEGVLPRTGERSTASYRAYVMITGLAPTFVSLLALGARSELAFESPRRCPVAPSIALCRSSDPTVEATAGIRVAPGGCRA